MICNTSICKYLVKFVVSKARDTLGWAKKKKPLYHYLRMSWSIVKATTHNLKLGANANQVISNFNELEES